MTRRTCPSTSASGSRTSTGCVTALCRGVLSPLAAGAPDARVFLSPREYLPCISWHGISPANCASVSFCVRCGVAIDGVVILPPVAVASRRGCAGKDAEGWLEPPCDLGTCHACPRPERRRQGQVPNEHPPSCSRRPRSCDAVPLACVGCWFALLGALDDTLSIPYFAFAAHWLRAAAHASTSTGVFRCLLLLELDECGGGVRGVTQWLHRSVAACPPVEH
jgi:hypothetical protein